MEKHLLNIPSVVSHSYFTSTYMGEKEINYFYSLLYLYRKHLLKQSKTTVLEKSKSTRKYKIHPEFENFKVKIELQQFNELGVVNNNSYIDLKVFFSILNQIKLKVNILGKNREVKSELIQMIKTYKVDKKKVLHIKFTDEFVKMIIHTEDYFMKVDLDILFSLSGYKSKKLYLLIKDYKNLRNECINISDKNLKKLIGNIPTPKIFNNSIDNINKIDGMDIKIEYPTISGKSLKEYKFYFKDISKKEESKSIQKTKPEEKKIDEEFMKQSKNITDKKIKDGKLSKDKRGAYQHTVYENLVKENESHEKTDDELWLENFVIEKLDTLQNIKDINKDNFTYFSIQHNGFSLHIDNGYCIYHPFGDITTENVRETIKMIQNWEKNNEVTYGIMGYSSEYANFDIFRIEL